jgi:hypothetical protein
MNGDKETTEKPRTHNSEDSLVVTHLTTNPPAHCLYSGNSFYILGIVETLLRHFPELRIFILNRLLENFHP